MNDLKRSLACTVVLFNPADSTFEVISSYLDQVDRIYVIDNSERYNLSLLARLKEIDKIVYVSNGGNIGIAAALNRAAQLAADDRFKFLLTMDQDTWLSEGFVSSLMAGIIKPEFENVGIIAPRYAKRYEKQKEQFQTMPWAMTSGNILRLSAYKKAGPFLEELFIDHVDHEYCLRLRQRGYRIIQANNVEIIHRPGKIIEINFFGIRKLFSSHSPKRLYYFCRNGLYVARCYNALYPEFRHYFWRLILKEICKIFFERDKVLRLRMIIKGYKDYTINRLGSLK